MKRQAVLFDLDGTLLPMDLDQFVNGYFALLAKRFSEYDPKVFLGAVWKGVKAMTDNDGSMTNEQRFWQVFCQEVGPSALGKEEKFVNFYATDFHGAKAFTGENPLAKQMISLAREKAEMVILATNPMFPPCGVASRLSWIGLQPSDFDYITTFDNSSCCKPAAAYYRGICEKFSLDPQQCLMVGNDLQEDGVGASQIGMPVHIVTDSLITHGLELSDWSHSTFSELWKYL